MNICPVDMNTKLVAVDYKRRKHDMFRVHNCLNHRDNRKVNDVKYTLLSMYSDGSVRFTQMKLLNDGVRAMFFIFGHYSLKRPIELDTFFIISFHVIR